MKVVGEEGGLETICHCVCVGGRGRGGGGGGGGKRRGLGVNHYYSEIGLAS